MNTHLTLYSIDTHFNTSTTDSFFKHCGKEEISRNEQFLLFQQCFLLSQKILSPFNNIYDIIIIFIAAGLEESEIGIWGKGLTLLHTFRFLTTLNMKALENTAGKGENAGNQHFLLFPQCFILYQRKTSIFSFSNSVLYYIKGRNHHFSNI